jgi:hypothetical protein
VEVFRKTVVDDQPSLRRSPAATALIVVAVAPLLVVFLASAWAVIGWVAGTSPYWPDPQLTLSEAAGLGNAGEVVRLITLERRDPNRSWPVREGILGSAQSVTPLEAAVSSRRVAVIPVLLQYGVDVPKNGVARTRLICRAVSAGAPDIVDILVNTGDKSDPRTECAARSN